MERDDLRDDVVVTDFKEFLQLLKEEKIRKDKDLLPITHIPDSFKIGAIKKDRHFKTFKGNKNYPDEELAFFTYGRNVYIPEEKKNLENDAYPPMVFVMDPPSDIIPKRMLPFDSGGFERYDLPKGMPLSRFEIDRPCQEDMIKLVFLLYRNNQNYLKYEHDFEQLAKRLQFLFPELEVLHQFYSKVKNTSTEVGQQGRSVEIQYDQEVPLKPILVLYPHIFATNEGKADQVEMAFEGATVLPYAASGNPRVYITAINEQITRFINPSTNTIA
ncbi:hypothetical protein HB364_32390 [Pseudoflavitalea sp. X16]|uniref:hypothetical protein n=1 Tax=Paraflavitalea devenefica TaxID=2716334 RepID=UPI001422AC8D|nr:hypothetical protein [Paraflavitalea devenefica]NII29822.1 hypothetical protein [Paraflavitalea devenefica]